MSKKNWASQKADEIYIQSSFKPSEYREHLENMLAEYDDWKTWRQIGGWCGTVVIENALLEAYKLGKEDTAAELTRLQAIEAAARKIAKQTYHEHSEETANVLHCNYCLAWTGEEHDDTCPIGQLIDALEKKTPA